MKIAFLPEALGDIERLFAFIAEKNPSAARKAMLAIDAATALIAETPAIGSAMKSRPAYRQFFAPFGRQAYVLRYRVDADNDTVVIVRVWHGRERRR